MLRQLTFVAMLAVAASTCSIRIFDDGRVRLRWSIEGHQDPTSCSSRGASSVHVVVRADADDVVADDVALCSSFEKDYIFHRGWYVASLTLTDESGAAASETRNTNAFYITPSFEAFEMVDFAPAPPAP